MKILITGAAGFIGHHLVSKLLARGDEVIGLDNINDYYDVKLKYGRLTASGIPSSSLQGYDLVQSTTHPNYRFIRLTLEDKNRLEQLFAQEKFDNVFNSAAQAGVRYSLEKPMSYIDSNIIGFINLLEACRRYPVQHLVYASSSSVYGLNEKVPFSTHDNVDHPVSLYAATKKSNELMAHAYSHLYAIPTTGLRFFTVYGPWGRPDMAYFLFTRAILAKQPISIFNHGQMKRDFTYIDDIIAGVIKVIDTIPNANPHWSGLNPDPASSKAPYRIYNIGNNNPVSLLKFVEEIEQALDMKAEKIFLDMQPGDVYSTHAELSDLETVFNYRPHTSLKEGIRNFVHWYRQFYDN